MLEPGKAAQFPVNHVSCTEVALLNGLGSLQYTHTHHEQTYTQLCEHSGFRKQLILITLKEGEPQKLLAVLACKVARAEFYSLPNWGGRKEPQTAAAEQCSLF